MRRGARQDFIEVFGGLDEVRLAQDDIGALGNLNADRFEFHIHLLSGVVIWESAANYANDARMGASRIL